MKNDLDALIRSALSVAITTPPARRQQLFSLLPAVTFRGPALYYNLGRFFAKDTITESFGDIAKAANLDPVALVGITSEDESFRPLHEHLVRLLSAHQVAAQAAGEDIIQWAEAISNISKLVGTGPDQEHGRDDYKKWPDAISFYELDKVEPQPPSFIIPDWLPCGYATLFAGHGGIGKSALALFMAVCMALGLPFFGMPVERRRVLYLSCEDRVSVLHWRLSRICAYLGIKLVDLNGWLDIIDLVGHETIVYQPGREGVHLTGAYRLLSARMKECLTQVLMVDGISDTYDGNENARAEVKAYVNSLLALIPPDVGAVLLIGHIDKQSAKGGGNSEGYSGSTAWNNAVRARWYLYPETRTIEGGRTEATGKTMIELQKSNLGPTGSAMSFEWDDSAKLFVGQINEAESKFDKNHREREEQAELLSVLIEVSKNSFIPAASMGNRKIGRAHV